MQEEIDQLKLFAEKKTAETGIAVWKKSNAANGDMLSHVPCDSFYFVSCNSNS